jgi:hypothetical protein
MRTILLSFLLLCGYTPSVFSLSNTGMLDFFYIKEQACHRSGSCFNLLDNGQKIGTLRPKSNTAGTFEFLDSQNQRQITIRFTGMRLSGTFYQGNNYTFDIYGKNRILLGKLLMQSEIGIVSFLNFKLFSPDERTVLAYGNGDLTSLNTKHYIFVKDSLNIIATLSRPLFTWSRDSDVSLIDKQLFFTMQDPNLLPAVLALYCMHDIQMGVDIPESISSDLFQDLQTQVQKTAEAQYSDQTGVVVTNEQLKAAAYLLHQRFREQFDESSLTAEEEIKQFIYFGCDLVVSHSLSPSEEQAILQVLTNRLMNM